MKNKYKNIGKFVGNYAFVTAFNTSHKGVIDIEGNEIIPVIYDGFIGSLCDQFMVGYKHERKSVHTPVDWDIDTYRSDDIYKTRFYLIDKEGHRFCLDFNSNSEVTYEGISYDGAIRFVCKYEYKGYLDTYYRTKSTYYRFYPGDDFVIIEENSDNIYIQYFDGTEKKISYKQFEAMLKNVKVKKL